MAYCKLCGAYIPDGQARCLACGFEEAQEPNAAAAAQQAKSAEKSAENTERLRRQMEEQRARQQEQSRKWAQQEAAKRKAQAQAQDGPREAKIPYSPEGDKTKRSTGFDFSNITGADSSAKGESSASTSKIMGIISYLSALCFLPLLICKNDEFATFHAKQGLALFIFTTLGNVLGSFLGIGWVFTVAQIFFIIKGISNANDGKMEPLPYIGTLFKF